MSIDCPLCTSASPPFRRVHARDFFACPECGLVFVHPGQLPSRAEERARYLRHNNDRENAGYLEYLRETLLPVRPLLNPGTECLDFGSGPVPVMRELLREAGVEAEVYDPIFAPEEAPLRRTYDLIVCIETIEHFHDPRREFHRLSGLLKPGGCLLIRTGIFDGVEFSDWWYVRDSTHVCFYRRQTLDWIAGEYSWRLERVDEMKDVCMFRRPERNEI